ncbi:MAG: hypothetical protein CO093_09990 [Alphaproteobacteria bacterium CG_4_9_14_3_um_filter_47_13]|nr:MAG: hypothetical protein CO093_09990 [Alphaproteobacteria bacterium CG_4_9_14_3_um_filter_47_13]
MTKTIKGIIAGVGVTFIMSALILVKTAMHILPGIDAVLIFTNISQIYFGTGANTAYGWALFFAISGVLYGALFGGLERLWPGRTDLTKGLWFGFFVWLVAMLVFAPLAGFGWFAFNYSIQAPILSLVGHLLYGAVLGVFYAWLNQERPLQIKEPYLHSPS